MSDIAFRIRNVGNVLFEGLTILVQMVSPREVSTQPTNTDKTLVAAALNGNGNAFGKIIEQYQTTISNQMKRFTRDQGTLEELVHDVFVEAYFSLKSYRASAPLIHWLRKIAVRVGYRYWKRSSRRSEQVIQLSNLIERIDHHEKQSDRFSSDAAEMLQTLLELLSERDRLVLTLIYWDGCTIAEAAKLSGWSQTMVKVQAYRARKRLQKMIEESSK